MSNDIPTTISDEPENLRLNTDDEKYGGELDLSNTPRAKDFKNHLTHNLYHNLKDGPGTRAELESEFRYWANFSTEDGFVSGGEALAAASAATGNWALGYNKTASLQDHVAAAFTFYAGDDLQLSTYEFGLYLDDDGGHPRE